MWVYCITNQQKVPVPRAWCDAAPVRQPKPICPGLAWGSTEDLAASEHLWVKSLLRTLGMSLFSNDQPGESSCTGHILQLCLVLSSTAALSTKTRKGTIILLVPALAPGLSHATKNSILSLFHLPAPSFPRVKGFWGVLFVPWSSEGLLLTRVSAPGCKVWTCSESEGSVE